MSLPEIGALLIRHTASYAPVRPIETVSSRAYTGIIIDARGKLPVQGEFITETGVPCIFPKVWDDTMTLLYERNMMNPDAAKFRGIVTYAWSDDESLYADRIGNDPLRISARKIYGINRTDPVISRNDALKILSVEQNMNLLTQGKIVILLDQEVLIHPVSAPVKDSAYYVSYQKMEEFYYENKVPEIVLKDTHKGIMISIRDLKFTADTAVLLDTEAYRLDAIAASLKQITESNEYTILVEGHTASVGKPAGEMELSIERAQTIIAEMVARGISAELFTYRGYGGTIPAGDNATEEGRAMNRRVEITVMPKTSYIQRN
jgi:outer membrane protein OmpA-like peptidoglycan-associated protein